MSNLNKNEMNSSKMPPLDLKSKIHAAQTKVESYAHQVEDRISERTSQAMKKSSDYIESTRQYVQENPVKSIAAAAVAGLAAGSLGTYILRRKKN